MLTRVVALGGACGVTDRSDGHQGSAFWFSFPYRPDETIDDDVHLLNGQVVSPRSEFNNREASRRSSAITNQIKHKRSDENVAMVGGRGGGGATELQQLHLQLQQSPTFKTTKIYGKETRLSAKGTPLIKILLTDDTQTILKVAGRMLRTNGHPVESAANGSQSLEKLKKSYVANDIDVLLTDVQMPVMDGIESTKRFRAWEEEQQCLLDAQGTPRRPRFLIIGMSANSDAQSKQEALDAGMDYFCPKPFNYQDFEAIIRARCGKIPIYEFL